MFDIAVQNGGISALVRAQIEQDVEREGPWDDREAEEVSRLRIVASRRAEAANPRWVEDVRARKLCIADGAGMVHGGYYDLEGRYGIRLVRASLVAPAGRPARGRTRKGRSRR